MKGEVIKHSAAIQIANRITLLQRRAWNVMLAEAYDALPERETHQMVVADLVEHLGITTRNDEHLRDLLRGLAKTQIEWNVLGKDGKNEWGVASLLADVRVRAGVVSYSFSPLMRHQLYSPSIYARVSLSIQNKFGSKHALALYELLVDYLGLGQTGWIPVEDFRALMGLEDGEYEQFKQLNQRVIKNGLDEINKLSDVEGEVEYRRDGRSVSDVKFYVSAKEQTPAKAVEAARTSSPAALPSRHAGAEESPDAFDLWWRDLSPLERSAREEEAEKAVLRMDPSLKGFALKAMLGAKLRELYAAR